MFREGWAPAAPGYSRRRKSSCAAARGLAHRHGHQAALAPEAPPLESLDAALQIGREMSCVALPQGGNAPVRARHPAAARARPARAVELAIGRAVAHGIVDGHLVAGPDPLYGDDGDLPVKAGIRLATVVDEVRRLVGRERGEIESLLDLHRMAPDLRGQLVQLLGRDDPSAPHGNELARLDHVSSDDGIAAGHVTILDFTFVGEVSRRFRAHETSAYRAERCAPQYIDERCPAAPGSKTARENPRRANKSMRCCCAHLQKKRASIDYWWKLIWPPPDPKPPT